MSEAEREEPHHKYERTLDPSPYPANKVAFPGDWKGEAMRKTQVAGASLGIAAIMLLSGCQCASRACSWVRRPFSRSNCEPAPQYISPSPQFGAPSQSISPVPMAPPSLQEETIPYSPPPYPPSTSGSGMR